MLSFWRITELHITLFKKDVIKKSLKQGLIKNKKIMFVIGNNSLERLIWKGWLYLTFRIPVIEYDKLENMNKTDNAVYFVCSLFELDEVCQELRKFMLEGIDFFCIKPIIYNGNWKKNQWKAIEGFPANWEGRTQLMTSMLDNSIDFVIDIGCGEGKLKKYIGDRIQYYGVDYRKRNKETIVADFNKGEFPVIIHEGKGCYFCSGCLEYVLDVNWFMDKLCDGKDIVLSYCVIEHNRSMKKRKKLAWENHLTTYEIVTKMNRRNYLCKQVDYYNSQVIFKFSKKLSRSGAK